MKHNLPQNPLQFIKRCVKQNKMLWTYHVNMRLKNRHITRQTIIDTCENSEIIEKYPEDKYLPSYLIYSYEINEKFHILFAVDEENDNVRIITAYKPEKTKWYDDLKTRRKIK